MKDPKAQTHNHTHSQGEVILSALFIHDESYWTWSFWDRNVIAYF